MSSSSLFFNLCPDLIFQLFEYFSLNELFDIFTDLIPCLPILLNQSHMKFSIDQNATEIFWNQILPEINSNQILSINHSHSIPNLSIYSSLQSINLNLQSSSIIHQFQSLIHLTQLSIQLSESIMKGNTWLSSILILPKLKTLKIDLNIPKLLLTPQRPISIDKSIHQSNTIECLHMKIPMSYQSLFNFLQHFPNLKVFRASLYQLDHSHSSTFPPSILPSLEKLDLRGYIENMSSMIGLISLSMPNLKHCRLFAVNVTTDNVSRMRSASIWKKLFKHCSGLIQVRIHLLMSINNNPEIKDLLREFNNNSFCEKYSFHMERQSIVYGYVTLTGNYQKKKRKRND